MKNYELLAVLPGTLTEEEAQEIAGQIKETSEKNGATNLTMEFSGKSRLAYPMRHIRYGYFFVFAFEATETQIGLIQEKIRLISQILRTICKIYNPDQKVSLNLGENVPANNENEPNFTKKEEVVMPEVVAETTPESAPLAEKTEMVEPETKPAKTNDVSMEEIDQKLDELLEKNDI